MEIIKNTVTEIVQGTTGQMAANMINPVVASIYGAEQYEIMQTDVADYKVTYNHNKSTFKVLPFLYDSSWRQLSTADIFSLTDSAGEISDEHWTLNVDNAIASVIHLIIVYLK